MGEGFQKKKNWKSPGYKPRPKFHKKVYLSECALKVIHERAPLMKHVKSC